MNARPCNVLPFTTACMIAAAGFGTVFAGERDFIQTFAGEPYMGTLEVRIEPPGRNGWTRYGRGSAHFTDIEDGRAKLVVFGAIDDEQGDAGFAVEGTYGDTGWKSRTDNVVLQLSTTGEIIGEGAIPPQSYRFSGSVSESTFSLDVRIELDEATANGLPPGTTFRFAYDLSRGEPVKEGAGDGRLGQRSGSRQTSGQTASAAMTKRIAVSNSGGNPSPISPTAGKDNPTINAHSSIPV